MALASIPNVLLSQAELDVDSFLEPDDPRNMAEGI